MKNLLRTAVVLSAILAPSAVLACISGPAYTWDWADPLATKTRFEGRIDRLIIGEFVDIRPMPSPAFRRLKGKVRIIKDYGNLHGIGPLWTGFVEVEFGRGACGFSPHVGDIGEIAISNGHEELPSLVSAGWSF